MAEPPQAADNPQARDPEASVELQIDGKTVRARPGTLIVDAAAGHGILIPSLCHQSELAPSGNCRLCMVEIEGWRTEAPACAMKVAPGMKVHTDTPRIAASRRAVLEMLLLRYHDPEWDAQDKPGNEFEYWCRRYGAKLPEGLRTPGSRPVDADPHPYI